MDIPNASQNPGVSPHGEEVHVEKVEKMEVVNRTQSFMVPLSIIVAGGLIGAGLYFGSSGKVPSVPSAPNTQQPSGTAGAPTGGGEVTIGDLPALGNPNAPVTIVEWGDYQCPFCERFFTQVEPKILEEYVTTGKARLAFRDFAFLGQESLWSANAARCANEQGKFWEFHDFLYGHQGGENQGAFNKDKLKGFAKELKLDTAQFNSCMDSDKYSDAVAKDTEAGRAAGVQGTPATFINGILVSGSQPFSNFQQIIEQELKK